MITGLLAAICAAWGIAVVDVIGESASSGGRTLSIFGNQIATGLSATVGVIAIAALACSAVVAIAFAWRFWRIGRIEREIDSEVERRWSELSIRAAGMEARNNLLEWRVPILQTNVDELLEKRDELLGDLQHISERKRVLKEMVTELERTTDQPAETATEDSGPSSARIVKLPEAPEVTPVKLPEPPEVTPSPAEATTGSTSKEPQQGHASSEASQQI